MDVDGTRRMVGLVRRLRLLNTSRKTRQSGPELSQSKTLRVSVKGGRGASKGESERASDVSHNCSKVTATSIVLSDLFTIETI